MRLGHRGVRVRVAAAALAALLLAAAAAAAPPRARAANLIRDAEIEETVAKIAHPLFDAARLDAESIDIFLVRDDRLNAFVAGGQNLFLNTGLLMRTGDPDQLAGVIAHETGHIRGGHLSRNAIARERATMESLVGAVLGAAAAAAGAPQVGTAIIAGGATVAQRGFLAFTRAQEQAADQAGVELLAATGRSPRGMLEFFRVLENQNLRITADGNAFLRTHPLTRDRMAFLEGKVADSPFKDARPDPALAQAHARMVAKLDGFLAEPASVLRRRAGDSLVDRYARAVAHFRLADLKRSLELLDGLIAERPGDPWFLELKGQVLFESGRIPESEPPYREALRLRPDAPLLRVGLARTLMEQGGKARLGEAAALLKEAVRLEPENAGAWRFLGVAQGQLGREGDASLSLAEAAVLVNRKADAELHLRRAQALIAPSDPAWYRVQDLVQVVAEMEEPKEERERPRRRPF
jgi:predicted Zn-dependent protease